MLDWITNTDYATWVRQSWGWALALTFHAFGNAIIVGLIDTVGRAFVMKRFHTRGRGRSARVEKHFAHLTVVVRERPEDRLGESA